jgi:tripartite-type tricarboxylate transporter receptor subunit TctC
MLAAPGGGIDINVRLVAAEPSKQTGQQVVVHNQITHIPFKAATMALS